MQNVSYRTPLISGEFVSGVNLHGSEVVRECSCGSEVAGVKLSGGEVVRQRCCAGVKWREWSCGCEVEGVKLPGEKYLEHCIELQS